MINFGTGGWRAIIGEDFVCENIRKVAAGIATLARTENKTDKPIIVGYDRRFLSDSAAKWVAEVLAAEGFTVWFMNRSAPTPLVMHTVLKKGLFYGIEITTSHNPAEYNGIKLIVEEGRDAPVETTSLLEDFISKQEAVKFIPFDEAVKEGKIVFLKNPFNDFLDDIMNLLDMKALRERGLRVLFDSMHGSGAYPLLTIFYTARCTIDTINSNKDAYFGGLMPAPSEQSLAALRHRVVREGYHLGIAMDGDGDRLGIIDKNGRYISANEILCMLYYYLVKYKGWKGGVVRNLATTHMLDR
ncbi:MAG: phosphoglucomutase/phosphomannomutase family protein, partial [Acutalibacteraceae bacterium]|nr:phosphoglucomutase/phosphomannomutase family protein [Acutalibacteraceae bacterium]